jgi:exonuclease VII small subunit
MFAAVDTIVALLVFLAIAAVSSWLKKRQQGDREDGPSPPSQAPSKPAGWEEELRRLLEGDEPSPPPPPRRPPPPPPVAPAPPVRPAPLPRATRQADAGEMDKGLTVELPVLTQSAQSYERASQLEQQVEQFMHRRAALSTSAAAFQRASQLDVKVSEHLRQAVEQASTLSQIKRTRSSSPEVTHALALLRHRSSVRSALLASVILGRPKALEG